MGRKGLEEATRGLPGLAVLLPELVLTTRARPLRQIIERHTQNSQLFCASVTLSSQAYAQCVSVCWQGARSRPAPLRPPCTAAHQAPLPRGFPASVLQWAAFSISDRHYTTCIREAGDRTSGHVFLQECVHVDLGRICTKCHTSIRWAWVSAPHTYPHK